ncbi:MAG: hypothetical protein KDD22_00375, partial [Bdellovibrionales bacterium]|nr:hypothetical protein [Bdellovibrionales bacterium]
MQGNGQKTLSYFASETDELPFLGKTEQFFTGENHSQTRTTREAQKISRDPISASTWLAIHIKIDAGGLDRGFYQALYGASDAFLNG